MDTFKILIVASMVAILGLFGVVSNNHRTDLDNLKQTIAAKNADTDKAFGITQMELSRIQKELDDLRVMFDHSHPRDKDRLDARIGQLESAIYHGKNGILARLKDKYAR